VEGDPPEFFPSQQEIYYYPKIGKMVWMANDVVQLVLYKNSEMTDLSQAVPAKARGQETQEDCAVI
jgi:spore germination cell wall hydrolase CwlJ-like protein